MGWRADIRAGVYVGGYQFHECGVSGHWGRSVGGGGAGGCVGGQRVGGVTGRGAVGGGVAAGCVALHGASGGAGCVPG